MTNILEGCLSEIICSPWKLAQLKSNEFEELPPPELLFRESPPGPLLFRRLNWTDVSRGLWTLLPLSLARFSHIEKHFLSQAGRRTRSERSSRVKPVSWNFNRRENSADLCKFTRCQLRRVFIHRSRARRSLRWRTHSACTHQQESASILGKRKCPYW